MEGEGERLHNPLFLRLINRHQKQQKDSLSARYPPPLQKPRPQNRRQRDPLEGPTLHNPLRSDFNLSTGSKRFKMSCPVLSDPNTIDAYMCTLCTSTLLLL
ncbi:unnamed protein product [Arctogadus glacialis]